jgi:hypothetical protein
MVLESFSTIGSIFENVATEKFQNNANNLVMNNNTMNNNTMNNNTMNNNLKKNMNLLVNPAVNIESYTGMELLGVVLMLIIFTLPAVVIAVRCNPKSPVLMGIVAFLFDRIYLFQHVIRKYMLKEKGYCKNIVVN